MLTPGIRSYLDTQFEYVFEYCFGDKRYGKCSQGLAYVRMKNDNQY